MDTLYLGVFQLFVISLNSAPIYNAPHVNSQNRLAWIANGMKLEKVLLHIVNTSFSLLLKRLLLGRWL